MSNRWKGGFIQAFFDPLTEAPPQPFLYTWGRGTEGQLGNGSTSTVSSPVQVGAVFWSQISAGGTSISGNVSAIKTDGTLWAWGDGADGLLGLNDTNINRSSPTQVGALNTWYQTSAGLSGNSNAAIKTDGTLWAWGNNPFGQLGTNNTIARSSPVQVGALTTWSQIAAGSSHMGAIKTDGTLWIWGRNTNGQLGNGAILPSNVSSPIQVGALTNWAQVSLGVNYTAAIKTDGTLWTWGVNTLGCLGQDDLIARSSPVQVGALTTWSSVSPGFYQTGAIKTDGSLWTWGNNGSGRLGLNDDETIDKSSPVQVGSLYTWAQISMGNGVGAAIKTDDTLWTWGSGSSGVTGHNDTIARSSPVQVGASTWTQISVGPNFMAAIEN